MGVYLEIIFTVLGGLIAGVVGLSSTYISLRARRREKHFEEHKENLRALKGALNNGKSLIWPFKNPVEDTSMPLQYEINPKLDNGIDFIISEWVHTYLDDKIYDVDQVLYKDIKNHFPKLFGKLMRADKDIKENAGFVFKDLNKISLSIYRHLKKYNPDITAMWPNSAPKAVTGETSKLIFNSAHDFCQQFVAGDVFLFAIKEDESNWPNAINFLKKIELYNTFKNIGDAVNNEMKEEISEMLGLREKLFSDIDDCINEIGNILHQTKLKGRCKLA